MPRWTVTVPNGVGLDDVGADRVRFEAGGVLAFYSGGDSGQGIEPKLEIAYAPGFWYRVEQTEQ